MTENEKKIVKEIHNEFKIMCLNFAADVVEEKFPEAFEPKAGRESIVVRIEKNKSHLVLSEDQILESLISATYWKEEAELTVTKLPAPESNGWTDDLVIKFVDEWEKYEGERFANCMQDFKQKNNIK